MFCVKLFVPACLANENKLKLNINSCKQHLQMLLEYKIHVTNLINCTRQNKEINGNNHEDQA